MARPKIPNNKKRKKISFTIDPLIYEKWIKYCEENDITNQSLLIEKLIDNMLKEKK